MSDSGKEWGQNSDGSIRRRNVISTVKRNNDIGPNDDGFQYFWVKDRGAFSANDLRVIADELDRMNEEWESRIAEDFNKDDDPDYGLFI